MLLQKNPQFDVTHPLRETQESTVPDDQLRIRYFVCLTCGAHWCRSLAVLRNSDEWTLS
jgi:hypothetical protein